MIEYDFTFSYDFQGKPYTYAERFGSEKYIK